MKKVLLVVLIFCALLGASYAGVSYWAGTQARKHYDLLIEKIARPNVEVVSESYERVIFTSRAVTTVTLKQPGAKPALLSFNIINSIQHGPFAFEGNPHLKGRVQPIQALISTHLAPGPQNGEELKKILDKFPELQSSEILTVLFWDGSGETYTDVPSFQKKIPGDKGKELSIAWGGFSSEAKFDVGLGEITGSFAAPSLGIGEDKTIMRFGGLKGDFNSHPGIKGLMVGSASVSLDNFEIENDGYVSLHLRSTGVRGEAGISGDTVDNTLGFHFDELVATEESFGPFDLEFEARNLDADALVRRGAQGGCKSIPPLEQH